VAGTGRVELNSGIAQFPNPCWSDSPRTNHCTMLVGAEWARWGCHGVIAGARGGGFVAAAARLPGALVQRASAGAGGGSSRPGAGSHAHCGGTATLRLHPGAASTPAVPLRCVLTSEGSGFSSKTDVPCCAHTHRLYAVTLTPPALSAPMYVTLVWTAAISKADPTQQQDRFLNGLQGGRAPLSRPVGFGLTPSSFATRAQVMHLPTMETWTVQLSQIPSADDSIDIFNDDVNNGEEGGAGSYTPHPARCCMRRAYLWYS
jgi:hypothetical protein